MLNNLVASLLWHCLVCVDPPSGLLAQIQAKMVNFFWDHLYWVPQGVLFLSREKEGQGLIHFTSRTATFRLQFVQRFLTGLSYLMWREVASCILRRANNLGLDIALLLTDSKLCEVGYLHFIRVLLNLGHFLTVKDVKTLILCTG